MLAVTAGLVDGGLVIGYSDGGDLATLTSYGTSYAVTGTGMQAATFAKSAVKSIRVGDATPPVAGGPRQSQVLLIGGPSSVTHPLSVQGIETTTLNTSISNQQFVGAVSFGGPLLLPASRSVSIANSRGDVLFGSTVNGAALLTLDAPGRSVVFTGKVGGTTPLARLSLRSAEAVTALDSVAVVARGKPLFSGIAIGWGVKALSLQAAGSSVRGFATGIEIGIGDNLGGPIRTIRNFTIAGNAVGIDFVTPSGRVALTPGIGFHDWSIEGNTIADNLLDGIRLPLGLKGVWTASDIAITNNTILRNKRGGIRVEGKLERLLISKNTLTGNGSTKDDVAIRVTSPLLVKNQYSTCEIADNTITTGDAANAALATGIAAQNLRLGLTGNTVTGLARGIALAGAFDAASPTAIFGNTVTKAGSVGIAIDSARGVVLSGGTVSGCPIGVLATGNCTQTSVSQTKLEGNDDGIRLSGATGIVIKNVAAQGNGSGIRLMKAQAASIQQASVTGSKTAALVATGDCKGTTVTGGTFGGVVGISLADVQNLALSGGFTVPAGGQTGLSATGLCSGTKVADGTITGGSGNGIELAAAKGLVLDTVLVKQHAGLGLKASGDLTATQITGATFTANGVGVGLAGAKNLLVFQGTSISANKKAGVSATGDCAGSVFSECLVKGNETGVSLEAATGAGVFSCTIQDNTSAGLKAAGGCQSSLIKSNTISGSGGSGAVLVAATGLGIYACKIEGSGQSGIQAEGNCAGTILNGNTIGKSGPIGISLSAAKGIAVKFGTVSSSGMHGLLAAGDCTGTTLSDAVFQGNGQTGIVLNAAKGLSMKSCLSQGNTAHGFQAYGACTGTTVAGSGFKGNKLMGFVLTGVQGLIVSDGNTIESNVGNGLYAGGESAGTKVFGNTIAGNGNAGLFLSAAKGLSVTTNTVSANIDFGLFATGVSTGTTVTGNKISGSKTNFQVTATGGTFQTSSA